MLFRSEVADQKRLRSLGRTVPLYASETLPVLTLLLLVVGAIALWLATGSYARTEIVSGWVVPAGPTARILPAQTGVLTSLSVHEGQSVRRGQRLATVEIQSANDASNDPGGQSLSIMQRQRARLLEQQRLSKQASAQDRQRLNGTVAQMRIRLAAMDKQIAIQGKRVGSAHDSFRILSDANQRNYISRIDFEGQRRLYLDEQARLQSLIADRAALRTQFEEAQVQALQLPIELDRRMAELDGSAMVLEQQQIEIEKGRTQALTAPISGTVAALQPRVGQSVTPRIPVLYILGEAAHLEVELYAPSRAIGFAHVGQEVRLMYDAFPYQQFGSFRGVVTAIARSALAPDEIEGPIKLDEPAYRIRVRLDRQRIAAFGEQYPIQPGMTLRANVILERQSFFDWLLEPINAVRRRT
ncbi:HlyD family efflux transporter periplasmic adaptor subunit [Sphingobium sp. AP49]|uniref:HlyD family efflux transporter periplasmic adaptor subunit n=1 Tax=Sphingobium sp. AP49 TaxID=1144307 RepID=UPI00026ECCB9|nr:HlyD family efflux transporter periplasmic adaptor subunit [Sphingobium sp. AP49]WHO38440.1 HlyD family efflux transporter periplasmic adaptor subunit [Sphingobium sp. AP49]